MVPDIVDMNFRDLGGLRCLNGRELRPGLLYRSGHLSALSAATSKLLLNAKIGCIVDLRHPRERGLFPTDAEIASKIPIRTFENGTTDVPAGDIRALQTSKERSFQTMVKAYRELPFVHAEAYGDLFRHLITHDEPLILHCAVGKDRTGVGIALVLTALGIALPHIKRDYLRSNEAAHRTRTVVMKTLREDLDKPMSEVLEPVVEASEAYLDAMFNELSARHGSPRRYFKDVLGLDSHDTTMLQDRLLRVI